MLVILSLLVLLGLCGITIRSNLISVVLSPQRKHTQADAQSCAGSTSSHTVHTERTVEMTSMRTIRGEDSNSDPDQEADPVQSSDDVELKKWKAIELLKVVMLLFLCCILFVILLFCRLQ